MSRFCAGEKLAHLSKKQSMKGMQNPLPSRQNTFYWNGRLARYLCFWIEQNSLITSFVCTVIKKIIRGLLLIVVLLTSLPVQSYTLAQIYHQIPAYLDRYSTGLDIMDRNKVRDRLIFFAPFLSYFSLKNRSKISLDLLVEQICKNTLLHKDLQRLILHVNNFGVAALPESNSRLWSAFKVGYIASDAVGNEYFNLREQIDRIVAMRPLLEQPEADRCLDGLFLPLSLEYLRDQKYIMNFGDFIHYYLKSKDKIHFQQNAEHIATVILNQFRWLKYEYECKGLYTQELSNLITLIAVVFASDAIKSQERIKLFDIPGFASLADVHLSDALITDIFTASLAKPMEDKKFWKENVTMSFKSESATSLMKHAIGEGNTFQSVETARWLAFVNNRDIPLAHRLLEALAIPKKIYLPEGYKISGWFAIRANLMGMYGEFTDRLNHSIHIVAGLDYALYLLAKMLFLNMSNPFVFDLVTNIYSGVVLDPFNLPTDFGCIVVSYSEMKLELMYFVNANEEASGGIPEGERTKKFAIKVDIQFTDKAPSVSGCLEFSETSTIPSQTYVESLDEMLCTESVQLRRCDWIKSTLFNWCNQEKKKPFLSFEDKNKLELLVDRLNKREADSLREINFENFKKYRSYVDMLVHTKFIPRGMEEENIKTAHRMKSLCLDSRVINVNAISCFQSGSIWKQYHWF